MKELSYVYKESEDPIVRLTPNYLPSSKKHQDLKSQALADSKLHYENPVSGFGFYR